ncbi:serine O-acetyltransferase [Candidatus Bathyarchaeota archaeon]|nr:MAG: serine O-acetyltransferase [Candidatus Bathyarchaeota archaeon]
MSLRELYSLLRKECSICLNISEDKIGLFTILRCYFFDSGYRLLLLHRLSRYFYLKFKNKRILWVISPLIVQHMVRVTGSMISPRAQIGEGCRIYYGTGIIIGSHAIIGKNATILNGITIGITHPSAGKQVTVIGDNVFIGTGAKILGNITIGDNVKVGANAVVLRSCGSNVTLVGVPARGVVKSEDLQRVAEVT